MMTEYEKMLMGLAHDGGDAEINAVRDRAYALVRQINTSLDFEATLPLMHELLGEMGERCIVRPPFHCEFGRNIRFGNGVFLNMGVTMLDGAEVHLGNNVMVGPNAQFYTASHSVDHRERRNWETLCKPIVVEEDAWIGGNVVINQGVTIGARAVVAAGAVVNHDVPADTLVGGVPARVIKSLRD